MRQKRAGLVAMRLHCWLVQCILGHGRGDEKNKGGERVDTRERIASAFAFRKRNFFLFTTLLISCIA
jgi:hypothetical protein